MTRGRSTRKRGFVLLTVVLVSAVLILSSLMFGAQLMAETRITKTDTAFKNALSLAETGLNTTLSEIKNSTSDAWAQYLQSGGHIGDVVPVASAHGTYQVNVTVKPGTVVDVRDPNTGEITVDHYTGTIIVDSTGVEYPPSVALGEMAGSTGYTARRRIQTLAQAMWTVTQDPGQPYIAPGAGSPEEGYWDTSEFGIGYGVFTGGDFSTQGSAMEINGDVYANGNADIKKNSISGGKVYAHGSLTGKPPAGSIGGVPAQSFPVIDTAYYRSLFTAYINGAYPYNGNVQIPNSTPPAYYTDTSLAANRAKYNVDKLAALTSEVTVDGNVYKTIPSGNATAALAYMTNPTASYFVSGDLHVNAQVTLTGTVVVDGTIFVNGGANILAGTKMPALLATGDFVKNNGNATINGLVYTEGSFTGVGTADIVGALYARGAVTMNGNMSITYDSSIDAVVTGATWVVTKPKVDGTTGQEYKAPTTTYKMDNVKRLEQSGRSWVELAPGS